MSDIFLSGISNGLMYLGPETIMPLASFIAAIIGIVLIFWRSIVGIGKKVFRKLTGKTEPEVYVEPEDEDSDNSESI